jgi:hypothetical protein
VVTVNVTELGPPLGVVLVEDQTQVAAGGICSCGGQSSVTFELNPFSGLTNIV